MAFNERTRGVYTIAVTPFTPNGALDINIGILEEAHPEFLL